MKRHKITANSVKYVCVCEVKVHYFEMKLLNIFKF